MLDQKQFSLLVFFKSNASLSLASIRSEHFTITLLSIIYVPHLLFSRLSKLEPSLTAKTETLSHKNLTSQNSVCPEITCQTITQEHLRAVKDYYASFQADQNILYSYIGHGFH